MSSFEDLLAAFEWVSADPSSENAAYVRRATGQVYWDTDSIETDEEFPEDIEDGTQYIAVPHKRDLDLGQALVFRFVEEYLPDEFDRVSGFFRRPGAYGKLKDMLDRKNILETWYEYEAKEVERALLQWISENSIPTLPSPHENEA